MRDLNSWLSEYGESHKNKTNIIIHKFCVPLITWTVVAFFWEIPTPKLLSHISFFNWSFVFVAFCLIFYLILSFKMFLGMLAQCAVYLWTCYFLSRFENNLLLKSAIIVFIVAWIFQFIGHKIEGKKPSFLKDIAFLLIGPLWVTNSFYSLIGLGMDLNKK